MLLMEPDMAYAKEIAAYRQEFLDAGDSMDGTGGLRRCPTVQEWVEKSLLYKEAQNTPENLVPATQFIYVREAAQKIKAQLNETGILSLVTPQGLPTGPRLLISLVKAGLYTPALLLCKTRFSQKRRQNSEG